MSDRPFQTALDPMIAPLIEELQRRGFRTLQSCSGHTDAESYPQGCLWIHGDDVTHEQLVALADVPGVDEASRLYGREAFPVAEVVFAGEMNGRYSDVCEGVLSILTFRMRGTRRPTMLSTAALSVKWYITSRLALIAVIASTHITAVGTNHGRGHERPTT